MILFVLRAVLQCNSMERTITIRLDREQDEAESLAHHARIVAETERRGVSLANIAWGQKIVDVRAAAGHSTGDA